jgi:uracil-DNA glycosylase
VTRRFAIPGDWRGVLAAETDAPYFHALEAFVSAERRTQAIYPKEEDVFTALALCPYAATRVVILGQDPYHGPGQAEGLAFSVPEDVPPPPSLVNIFKELSQDLGVAGPWKGSLRSWARQGVLLLNTVLTVREGQAHSHQGHGWERFTDAVIHALAHRPQPLLFLLWGKEAAKKAAFLEGTPHKALMAAHPSPLSAHRGFLGSRPFSSVNRILREQGQPQIDWLALVRRE